MASNDNVKPTELATLTFTAAADELTYSGDVAKVQLVRHVLTKGPEGGKTFGVAPYHRVSTGDVNAAVVKNAPCGLKAIHLSSAAAYKTWLKLHNQTTNPTAGQGVAHAYGVQAGLDRDIYFDGDGLPFDTGLAITIISGAAGGAAGAADGDTAAVLAGDLVVGMEFIY